MKNMRTFRAAMAIMGLALLTSGPATAALAASPESAACGPVKTSTVTNDYEYRNFGRPALFTVHVKNTFDYDGCRTWEGTTDVTYTIHDQGIRGHWSFDRISDSSDTYITHDGQENYQTRSDRTAVFKNQYSSIAIDASVTGNPDGSADWSFKVN